MAKVTGCFNYLGKSRPPSAFEHSLCVDRYAYFYPARPVPLWSIALPLPAFFDATPFTFPFLITAPPAA
jgi:hypothetical protein